jgi:hypothetical protein
MLVRMIENINKGFTILKVHNLIDQLLTKKKYKIHKN